MDELYDYPEQEVVMRLPLVKNALTNLNLEDLKKLSTKYQFCDKLLQLCSDLQGVVNKKYTNLRNLFKSFISLNCSKEYIDNLLYDIIYKRFSLPQHCWKPITNEIDKMWETFYEHSKILKGGVPLLPQINPLTKACDRPRELIQLLTNQFLSPYHKSNVNYKKRVLWDTEIKFLLTLYFWEVHNYYEEQTSIGNLAIELALQKLIKKVQFDKLSDATEIEPCFLFNVIDDEFWATMVCSIKREHSALRKFLEKGKKFADDIFRRKLVCVAGNDTILEEVINDIRIINQEIIIKFIKALGLEIIEHRCLPKDIKNKGVSNTEMTYTKLVVKSKVREEFQIFTNRDGKNAFKHACVKDKDEPRYLIARTTIQNSFLSVPFIKLLYPPRFFYETNKYLEYFHQNGLSL